MKGEVWASGLAVVKASGLVGGEREGEAAGVVGVRGRRRSRGRRRRNRERRRGRSRCGERDGVCG